jgi:hypothetical protein
VSRIIVIIIIIILLLYTGPVRGKKLTLQTLLTSILNGVKLSFLANTHYVPGKTVIVNLGKADRVGPTAIQAVDNLLTARSRVVEKLTVVQLVNKFRCFHENRSFITVFRRWRH